MTASAATRWHLRPGGRISLFDETDLLSHAEAAGLTDITVNLELTSTDRPLFAGVGWTRLLAISPNPDAPTFGEAVERALTADEAGRLEAQLRPLVDQGCAGRVRHVNAYVTAARPQPWTGQLSRS